MTSKDIGYSQADLVARADRQGLKRVLFHVHLPILGLQVGMLFGGFQVLKSNETTQSDL